MTPKKHEESLAKRIGIWIRVSTEDQARGESPKHHEERARQYAGAKGWTVVEAYHLEGVSGKTVMDHPEAQRMLKDVERGHITGLIFSKLARLGRNTRELLDFSEFFQKHDADLISLQESIDTSTPAGRLFYTMIAGMAHWEREEIASRVAASVPIRAKLGKPLGGQAPFGYRWDDKKLVLDPEEVPVRKLAFELFLEVRRIRTVTAKLNEMGHRMRKGKMFCPSTVLRLIADPAAKGLHRVNYVKSAAGSKMWEFKPESDWLYIPCPAIVSEEVWDQCHVILGEQRSKRKPPAKRAVQLFGGLTWCACGGKMYVKSNTPKYVCQECNNKIAIVDLEDIFMEQLKGFMLSQNEIEKHLEGANKTIHEKTEMVALLEREQAKVRQEMDRIFQLYMDDRITKEGFGERYRPHEDRIAQLSEEVPRLQAEIDFLKVNLLSSDKILHQAKTLHERWPHLGHQAKREVIETITEKITIGKDEIQIDLFYLPTSHEPWNLATSNEPDDDDSESSPKKPHRTANPFRSTARAFPKIMAKGMQTLWDMNPFCHVTLKCVNPTVCVIQRKPSKTTHMLGDHIVKHRLELGLTQEQLARHFGVCVDTIYCWERNQEETKTLRVPAILRFLGYCPIPEPEDIPAKVRHFRWRLGLSPLNFGKLLGVSRVQIMAWEEGREPPLPKLIARMREVAGIALDDGAVSGRSRKAES